MSAEAEAPSVTEYEFEPFEKVFLRRREQIETLVGVTRVALLHMSGAARLSEVLKKPSEHVEFVRSVEDKAQAEINADMPLVHGSAAVLLWGALEASVRDFLVRWLTRYPTARLSSDLKTLRVKVVEYESLSGEDRMRYLVNALERELSAALRPGIARFECLLSPFGIHASIEDADRRTLNELAAIRNVIVHRAGLADARLLQLCPWLELELDDEVRVGQEAFVRYRDAASRFAASLIEAATELAKPLRAAAK